MTQPVLFRIYSQADGTAVRDTLVTYEAGTISEFIQRKKKFTLIDVFKKLNSNEYPKLRRCMEFIVSLQPVTSRVESMFSVLGHNIRANMYGETIEKEIMLKLDRVGGIRKYISK